MSVADAALPGHWCVAPLGDVADIQLGKMLDRKRTKGTPAQYLRNINVRWGRFDLTDLSEMPFTLPELERFSIRTGDVLVCEGGEPGRAAVWKSGHSELKYQKALHRVRLHSDIVPDWLVFHLLHDAQLGSLADSFTGTTIGHLPREVFIEHPMRVPPSREQQRIVETLESLFSRLDDAVASLERVQRNLKRYRAAVLQAAVEGRLVPTEAELARAEGRSFESASELLARILAERRRRWEEAELAKLRAKGKEPRNDAWKAKYVEPEPPKIPDLAPLPTGWCWSSLRDIAELKGGITKDTKRAGEAKSLEVPYLRVANVQRGYLDLSEVKTISASEQEIKELVLQRGDILFNEGGDRDKLGRGWIWQEEIAQCIHQNHVFRARLLHNGVQPKLISWYGNSSGQRYFIEQGKQTTNLASLNITKLGALPVPLPPAAEQVRIVEEVERLLSVSDDAGHAVVSQLTRCHRLRQSILKWAFEGKLVDQDPSDEPASVLLERIRAERAWAPARPGRGRRARAAQGPALPGAGG